MAFDWSIWAANFPLSWSHEEAMPEAGLPERIVISRAGKELTLTLEEFAELSRGLMETLAATAGTTSMPSQRNDDD